MHIYIKKLIQFIFQRIAFPLQILLLFLLILLLLLLLSFTKYVQRGHTCNIWQLFTRDELKAILCNMVADLSVTRVTDFVYHFLAFFTVRFLIQIYYVHFGCRKIEKNTSFHCKSIEFKSSPYSVIFYIINGQCIIIMKLFRRVLYLKVLQL